MADEQGGAPTDSVEILHGGENNDGDLALIHGAELYHGGPENFPSRLRPTGIMAQIDALRNDVNFEAGAVSLTWNDASRSFEPADASGTAPNTVLAHKTPEGTPRINNTLQLLIGEPEGDKRAINAVVLVAPETATIVIATAETPRLESKAAEAEIARQQAEALKQGVEKTADVREELTGNLKETMSRATELSLANLEDEARRLVEEFYGASESDSITGREEVKASIARLMAGYEASLAERYDEIDLLLAQAAREAFLQAAAEHNLAVYEQTASGDFALAA